MAAEAAAQPSCVPLRVVVCSASAVFENAPTVCGMQRKACWMRGLGKGTGGKGVGYTERKREEVETFEQCRQEVLTQFSIGAVNQRARAWK